MERALRQVGCAGIPTQSGYVVSLVSLASNSSSPFVNPSEKLSQITKLETTARGGAVHLPFTYTELKQRTETRLCYDLSSLMKKDPVVAGSR